MGGIDRIQDTLGTLLRSTIEQVGAVTEVARRQAESSRRRLDGVMRERRRRERLAELGEVVCELLADGAFQDLLEIDEVAEIISDIEYLDDDHHDDAPAQPRGWRDAIARDLASGFGARRGRGETSDADGDADGGENAWEAVSSSEWTPPRRKSGDDAEFRVWRPVIPEDAARPGDSLDDDDDDVDADDVAAAPVNAADAASDPRDERLGDAIQPVTASRRRPRRGQSGGGGIAFVRDHGDDDDDLSAYMHEDDVRDDGER